MEGSSRQLLRAVIRRVPSLMLQGTVARWAQETDLQLGDVDFTLPKHSVTDQLIAFFQERGLGVKHITELEMIHIIDNPRQGKWWVFELLDAEDEAQAVDLIQFKEQFKAHLKQINRLVSIKIKKHTDDAVWIRIAWGDIFSPPNHLRPTYVVHHLQTPYVFVNNITSKHKPLLNQALVLATRHGSVKECNLSGKSLTDVRNLVMRQYQQVFPRKHPHVLQENKTLNSNPNIRREDVEDSDRRLQVSCEAFGDGALPRLENAFYKLETKFKDSTNKTMTEMERPIRATVKFSSTNILESLRHCVSSGICSTPVTPLFSSITHKGRNHFVIADKVVPCSSQIAHP